MKHWVLIVACFVLGCGESEPEPEPRLEGLDVFVEFGPVFVADGAFRREALERSLVDRSNGYAQLRLDNYRPGGWDDLPIRNFAVRPVTTADFGRFDNPLRVTNGPFDPVFRPERFEWTHEALLDLGERAFHNYPLELTNRFEAALESPQAADELGVWTDGGRVGGIVRARLSDGGEMFASTCATCHAAPVDGELVVGAANARLDTGAMQRRTMGLQGSDWWPGAVDVTPDGADNGVAITDLRAIRHQKRLHWAATLDNSPEALAVRIETLMITSANESMRPPREVVVALAYYLWWLGEEAREPAGDGSELFEATCGSCHGAVDAVAIESVGTDPAVGLSSMRGTGEYRVPSLYKVASRTQFLHQGKVKSLERLFEPERLQDVPGHPYGTELADADRVALLELLQSF